MSETVPDADAIAKANCRRCKATKGNPCVYTPPPRPEWIPEAEFLARIPTNADLRRRFERAGKPMKGVHQERRDTARNSAPRGTHWRRVEYFEWEEMCTELRRLRAIETRAHSLASKPDERVALIARIILDDATAGLTDEALDLTPALPPLPPLICPHGGVGWCDCDGSTCIALGAAPDRS